MASHEELVSQFTDVTGVEPERAQFYLESSAWQLEVALASFYENDEPTALINERAEDYRETSDKVVESAKPSEMEGQSAQGKSKAKSRFATLTDLKDKESSPEDEDVQTFYAGGFENSGQQVLGPAKKKDIISDMFKSCQGHSVEAKPKPQQRPNTFSGTGYKLGQTNSDTEVVTASSSSNSQPNSGPITLKLWKNGFTVNDSDLRSYNDPENRKFLDTIKRGEIPPEIRQEIVRSTEAWIDMEDRRHEIYLPQKVKVKAFAGKGHMLGSPSPATVGMTIPTDLADQAANESEAKKQLNLDESKPITTLQIRLADGTNVKAQFNLTHTINDLRQYIVTMRPQYAMREFSLLTTYPTKELNEDKTIEEAGIQNTAIIQRLK
ncbi:NSFL1 cofactor p47 isoform X2 [Nomia melanderi]|uniref:NSFL1 cofactor p47 isoform X2 n=1 Tax=Nomia melanderi TaxID=2448451 RepID=UPI0013040D29|nr:NSFL1 cofactor p47-like isoform X2 [Nomia melanderi]